MAWWKLGVCVLIGLMLSGCASITLYDDAKMTSEKQGLKFYYSKPYLLVARDGTEKVTSVSVIYLPDLEHPVYAKATSGYGSSNLTMAFSNSIITSFGQQTDTKIPETLTATGGLLSSYGTLAKALADADSTKAGIKKQASDLPGDATKVNGVADDLRLLAISKTFSQAQSQTLLQAADELYVKGPPATGIGPRLNVPGAAAEQDKIVKDLQATLKKIKAVKVPDQPAEASKADWNKLAALESDIEGVIKDLQPPPAAVPVLTLYEIKMESGNTSLVEVPLPPALKP